MNVFLDEFVNFLESNGWSFGGDICGVLVLTRH